MNRLLALAILPIIFLFSREPALAESPGPTGSATVPFRCTAGTTSFALTLRLDFSDVGLFKCPKQSELLQAAGAQVSSSFDELAHHTAIAVDGVAAMVVRYYGDDPGLLALAMGPYVQGNGTYQFRSSNSPGVTSDTLAGGAFVQLGFNNSLVGGQDYLRFRGGEQFGSSGVTSDSFVSEWLPVYGGPLHIGTPGRLAGPIFFLFSPELMLQYDRLEDGPNKYLLFSAKNEALRVGPQLVARFWVNTDLLPVDLVSPIRTILDRTTVNMTYHASTDAYTGRDYSWALAGLTYNLDSTGHFGISANYGYGNSETTGNKTSQVKIGLAAKF
jgi:hypothetical protein